MTRDVAGLQMLWPTPLLTRSLENHVSVNAALVELFTADRAVSTLRVPKPRDV